MRRALLTELPQFTRFYGLSPADLDDMTHSEVAEYVAQMRQAIANTPEGVTILGR